MCTDCVPIYIYIYIDVYIYILLYILHYILIYITYTDANLIVPQGTQGHDFQPSVVSAR